MLPNRIAELLEPFLAPGDERLTTNDHQLTTNDLDQISTYIDLLLRWNARINLTAIRDPEQIVTRHFGESFFLARHLFPPATAHRPLTTVLDLGSGAGFPGLPIKIWEPSIHLTLVESNHKKAAFLREVARALTLTDINVIAERAESLAPLRAAPDRHSPKRSHRQGNNVSPSDPSAVMPHALSRMERLEEVPPFAPADVVTFRAVERFERTLSLALRFLTPSSRLALLITTSQLPALRALSNLSWVIEHVPESHERLAAIGIS